MTLPPVATLLPHGPGMVLIDRLVAHSADAATSEIAIHAGSRFAEGTRGVPGWVGLEYMAQTVAAFEGLNRLNAGKPVQVGLLLGCRTYRCAAAWFAPGRTLTCELRLLLRGADGVTVSACTLREGAATLAEAEIKAYQPDDIEPFLQDLAKEAA